MQEKSFQRDLVRALRKRDLSDREILDLIAEIELQASTASKSISQIVGDPNEYSSDVPEGSTRSTGTKLFMFSIHLVTLVAGIQLISYFSGLHSVDLEFLFLFFGGCLAVFVTLFTIAHILDGRIPSDTE